jgi:hypothetical protein
MFAAPQQKRLSPILTVAIMSADADVAQWQSNGLISRRLMVQIHPSAPKGGPFWGRFFICLGIRVNGKPENP